MRRQSSAGFDPKRNERKGDYDKSTIEDLYHKGTDVPIFIEDWTLDPPPADKKEKEWQRQFHQQAQPLLKLSALLNMPLGQSKVFFAHYDVDDEFKQHLALFAGATALTPMDGTKVSEPGSVAMVMKALKALDRAGSQKVVPGWTLTTQSLNAWP